MGLLRFELLLPGFALVLARMSGVMLAMPMLNSAQVPRMIKVLLAFTMSLIAFPVVMSKLPVSLTLAQTTVGAAGEFLIGEVLGLAAGLVFYGAQMAGKIVSHQSGFALGEVFNPLFDEEFTVLDQIWFFAVFMFFLALRGHIAIISLILRSFDLVPPMMLSVDGSLELFATSMARTTFEVALRLAGPAVLALMLASLVMGFLTKSMPQMNVMSVGFTFKIMIALLVVGLTISSSESLMTRTLSNAFDQVGMVMEQMSKKVTHG